MTPEGACVSLDIYKYIHTMNPPHPTTPITGSSTANLPSEPPTPNSLQPPIANTEAASKTSKTQKRLRLTRSLQKLTSWLGTTEPSAQALIQHRKETFSRAGIAYDDTDAHAKLHAPIGKIPRHAIRPSTGPDPEEVLLGKKGKGKGGRRGRGRGKKDKDRELGGGSGGGSVMTGTEEEEEEEGWSIWTGGESGSGSNGGGGKGSTVSSSVKRFQPYTG